MNRRKKNGERGSAFILVLIALALGSLIITPTLSRVGTGLVSSRVSEDILLHQYSADAAAEFALWQLKYDGLGEVLSLDNPTSNTTITINGEEIPIITEISFSPQDEEGSFNIPGSQSGIHISAAMEIRPVSWVGSGQKQYMTHIIYVYNSGTAAVHLNGLFQQLDPNLKYVQDSYDGPEASFAKTLVDGSWELHYNFDTPLPKLWPGDIMVITFTTWAQKDMGEYTFTGDSEIYYAAFGEDIVETFSGESGVASFGLYDVTVTAGPYTILVNVGITETGEIVVRSWQIL